MQPEHLQKKTSYRTRTIWLTTFFLTILVFATAAVLYTCLYSFVHKSDFTIPLFTEDIREQSVASQTTSPVITHTSHLITTNASSSSSGSKGKSQVDMDVSDNAGIWVTDTDIELFHTSYKNADGEVTVRSGNSDKVVAPGTEGSYTFSVKNTGKKDADCKMWMETQMDAALSGLPFQVRLHGSDGWLIGTETEWKDASELDTVSVTEYIPVGKSLDYTLYWQWPFEEDIDIQDTQMGNITAGQNLNYNVTIHTQATESANGQTEDAGKNGKDVAVSGNAGSTGTSTEAARTGDDTQTWLWIVLLVLSAAEILLLKAKRRLR